MAVITICSDFGAPQNKVSHCPDFGCGVAPLSRSCIVHVLLHMTAAMKLKDTYSLEEKL